MEPTRQAVPGPTERLHWLIQLGERTWRIDLLPALLGPVRVEVEGRRVDVMSRPTPQHPWQELELDLDGEDVVIALRWHWSVMRTNVFVDGRSVWDGEPLEQARRAAPSGKSNFEVWFARHDTDGEWASRSLLTRSWAVICLVALVPWAVAFALAPIPGGLLRAIAAVGLILSSVVLFAVWYRSWLIVLDRVHVRLLRHPEVKDRWRVLAFYATVAGYPLLSWATLLVILVAIDTLA